MVMSVTDSVQNISHSFLPSFTSKESQEPSASDSIFRGPFEGGSFSWSAEPIFSRGSSPIEGRVFRCGVKDEPVKTETVTQPETPLVCTLMATEIPTHWVLQIGEDPFDLRYFVKGVLTQKSPINPYTRQKLSAEELTQICSRIGISPAEFEGIWRSSGEGLQGLGLIIRSMGLISQVIDLSSQLHQARARGDRVAVASIESRLDGVRRDLEQLGGVEDGSRRKNLEALVFISAEQGRISRDDANDFIAKLAEGG